MRHRHLNENCDPNSLWAIEDVLDRGHMDDWRELAHRIVADPQGPAAQALQAVLEYYDGYGTATLWRDFLARAQKHILVVK